MPVHDWPSWEPDELYRLFLQLVGGSQPETRERLIQQIIVHSTLLLRLNTACGALLRHRAYDDALRDDVMQAATLLVIERLSSSQLSYHDEGADRFRGWIYRLCRNAVADAWRSLRPNSREIIVAADAQPLASLAAPPERELRDVRLLRAIAAIPDPALRMLMQEESSGMTLQQSAERRGVSLGTIYRMRNLALAMIRRYFEEEPDDLD